MYYIDESVILRTVSTFISIPVQKIQPNDNKHSKLMPLNINSYIEGQSFEKNISQKYPMVKYIVESAKSKELLAEVISLDGSFKIENLPSEDINLFVIDTTNAYNGKCLMNIPTQLDLVKSMDIIRVYQTSTEALIKIKINGDVNAVSVFATNANIVKVDDFNYKVNNITGEYTVTLHDYVDNVLYTKEKIYR